MGSMLLNELFILRAPKPFRGTHLHPHHRPSAKVKCSHNNGSAAHEDERQVSRSCCYLTFSVVGTANKGIIAGCQAFIIGA